MVHLDHKITNQGLSPLTITKARPTLRIAMGVLEASCVCRLWREGKFALLPLAALPAALVSCHRSNTGNKKEKTNDTLLTLRCLELARNHT
jgi:hypothetical protein